MKKQRVFNLAVAMGLLSVSLLASSTGRSGQPRSIQDQVRHELLMVPYIGVFDNLSFTVDANGVVTLLGEVTRPIDKDNLERAVKFVKGVTSVKNGIEVLPLSLFDDQIRARTLRALLRTPSLYKYFAGTNPGIRIIVKNGNVTLDGEVLNQGDRTMANMAANSVFNVFSVTNNLGVEVR